MSYQSKFSGAEVDSLLEQVQKGEAGGKVTVDSSLSTTSENPVMNKAITSELNKKATKEELTELSEDVDGLSEMFKKPDIIIDDIADGYFNTKADTLPPIRNTLSGCKSAKIAVSPNEVFEIYGFATFRDDYYQLWGLYDSEGNRIDRYVGSGSYRDAPYVMTIPSEAVTMVVNLTSYDAATDKIIKIGAKYNFDELDKIPLLEEGLDALHDELEGTKEYIDDFAIKVFGVEPAAINVGYLNSDTTIYGGEGYAHYAIPIQPNDVIEIKAKKTILTQYAVASAYSLEGKTYVSSSFIQGRQTISAGTTYSFVAPADAKWLLINKTINKGDYTPDIIKVNGHNVKDGEPSSVGVTSSFVKYTASKNEFEVFMWNGECYYSAVVALNTDEAYCQKVWRIAKGSKYNKSREKICNTIDTGENEFVLHSADFHGNGSHTGGVHGGELVDGDSDCFVKFFVDGSLVLDLTKDFEKECTTFEYVELTTLNKVIDSEGNPIVGTPIFAKHLKNTKFEGCGISVRNIVSFTDAVTINQYFAGLFCVSKDSATKAILPFGKLMDMVGDSSTYEATDKDDSTIIMWDEGNEVKVTISSEYVRGIDFSTTGLKQYENIWDRSIDTKYYRYCLGNLDYKNGDIVETKTHIQFD